MRNQVQVGFFSERGHAEQKKAADPQRRTRRLGDEPPRAAEGPTAGSCRTEATPRSLGSRTRRELSRDGSGSVLVESCERAHALRESRRVRRLWVVHIRGRCLGVVFRWQVPLLARFTAGFLAPAPRGVVEGDGAYHGRRKSVDARGDAALERAGQRVVRSKRRSVRTTRILAPIPMIGHRPISLIVPTFGIIPSIDRASWRLLAFTAGVHAARFTLVQVRRSKYSLAI